MSADVAVVTGAGSGIGRAVARRLASDGVRVVAAGRTEATLAETAAAHEHIAVQVTDISREAEVERLAAVAEGAGRLRAWVNCAAVVEPTPFEALDPEGWDRVLDVNLRGIFLCCRAAFAAMRSGGGTIVNFGSLSGVPNVEKFPGLSAYNVSKAGVIALSEAVALEGKAHRIRCMALSPGAVDTEMLRRAAPHLRPGVTPDDVAAIVAFLLSDAGAALSGVNVPIFSNE
ncbi:MAG TPA: SDR family oxidoreductase [Candidatus Dormibacteraeota bacterium]|jgi:NAD(P)-dependent dehydrogenase (short-subunit alcohol dehydrogenase family)|nr:SDR family oxidoreductase [Candidatus Dormibacteraeota bacterium]